MAPVADIDAEIEEIDDDAPDLEEEAADDVPEPEELEEEAAAAAGADPGQANAAAADIGILANNNSNNSNSDDASSESSSSLDPITSRWDVYESIEYGTEHCGNCCYSDIADGSTTSPALPPIIGLRISGVGKGNNNIPLPITDEHADKIKAKATKKKGAVYGVDADKIKIQNPQWGAALEKLCETVAYKLGVSPMYLTAELGGLMLMEKGGYIGKRCDNDVDDGGGGCLLGSLFIQLPSKFTGGEMTVYNTAVGEFDDNDDGESFKFSLGSGKEATYSCHYACLFADCEYEFVKLKSGSRILLQYSLFYEQVTNLPTASLITESRSQFKWALNALPPMDRMVVIPLEKEYDAITLVANSGINALSRAHREKAEAIKVAGEDWKLVIVNAKLVHTCGYGYASHRDNKSIIEIFDEAGSRVTGEMGWLKNVVDFDSVEHDGGMLLALDDEGYCVSNWGDCKSRTGAYESTQTYRATFLVSFDPEFETELKCLGGCGGVAEVCKMIVDKRDYDLLDRVLAVVETKEKSRFDVNSCQALLQMLVKSRKEASSRVALVKQVISGLSSSLEPNDVLYDTIIEIVDKLGHEDLLDTIGGLLDNAQRKSHQDMSIFLRRMDFGLKLSERIEGGDSSYLEGAINDLATTCVGVSDSTTAVNTIMDLITEYNDVDLSSLVGACLNFFHRKSKTLRILMERTRLLESLLATNKFGSLELSLVEFATDFAGQMQSFAHSSLQRTVDGQEKEMFVKATEYVMEFGTPNCYDKVGYMSIRTKKLFSSFINAIVSVSGEESSLLRDVLNKCLLQYSITSEHITMYHWTTYIPGEPSVPPTPPLHVQKVLELYPNVVHTVDNDGRLPLHYATASSTASVDVIMEVFGKNKDAASIADPMTRLFPFQLAAASDNVEASFSLLLANPCLVSTGIKSNDKKRKRNQMTP